MIILYHPFNINSNVKNKKISKKTKKSQKNFIFNVLIALLTEKEDTALLRFILFPAFANLHNLWLHGVPEKASAGEPRAIAQDHGG